MLRRALIVFALLGGCTFEGELLQQAPGGGPPVDPLREQFETDVVPILMARCTACHAGVGVGPGNAPRFLGDGTPANYYAALVGSAELNYTTPAESRLIVTGVHYGGAGPAFEPAVELPTVRAWIEMEAAARQP
jgi:hypothetical protein